MGFWDDAARWTRDRRREIPDPVLTAAEYANPVTGTIKMWNAVSLARDGDPDGAVRALTTPSDYGAGVDIGTGDDKPLIPPTVLLGAGILLAVGAVAAGSAVAYSIGRDPAGFALRTRNAIREYKET